MSSISPSSSAPARIADQLIDMIGLDIHRAKMQTLRTVLDDPRYAHPPIVDRLVEEGRLGKKVGKGFYDYVE